MYLLGYDIGTSSVKACFVDAETDITAASDFFPKQEAPIKSLKPGWAEQAPESWWTYLKEATHAVMQQAKVTPEQVKAIGIAYQMHGVVLVDRNGNVLRDAIIWCDSRGVPYGNRVVEQLGADTIMSILLNKPGNFTATKLAWVKEHEPELFQRIWAVMLPGDFAAWRMTGECVTSPEGLSEYMLWDFRDNKPAEFLMKHLGFPMEILPRVVPTFGCRGELTATAATELGLKKGTPVTYCAGDQPNNALSLNVFEPGEIASTAGTSGVVYGVNDKVAYDPLSRVNNFAHVNHTANNPRIGVMTCINGTGILNSWMKKNIAQGCSYDEMNNLAALAPVGSAGVTILPFGNGAERILENRAIGCSMHGINFNIHNRSHLLRATQEGIVFSFMYGIEIMEQIGLHVGTIHAGNANMFLSPVFQNTLSSVSGAVIKLFDTDGAAGAARGAGIGLGFYASTKEAFASLKIIREIHPASDRIPYLEAYSRWKDCLVNELSKLQ